jgi:hypothetical protein
LACFSGPPLGNWATDEAPRAATTGAFVQSLNAMIDAQSKRNALQQTHVPETVLLFLFIVWIASGAMIGYSGGLSGKRIMAPVVLVTLIVFIITDLDRPKRGLMQVNQAPCRNCGKVCSSSAPQQD